MSEEGEDENEDRVAKAIAREVEEAFSTVAYPGNDRLVASPTYWGSDDVIEAFRGKHWRDISLDVLFAQRLSLPLFSATAFHFYLPAYLSAALLHSDAVDTLRENVFFVLTPPDDAGAQRDGFLDRMSLLDARQREVILRFIELYVEQEKSYPDPDREKALAFWSNR